ncbi:MAG: squalene/phytoene synthase family protein, partial [Planctomycetia bacterium]
LHLCRRFTPERARLSDCVCTGLQLVNFWQDVARDLDKGRIYLPQAELLRFGVTEEDLTARRFTPAFAELMRFQVDRAEALRLAGRPLAAQMPGRLKLVVALFAEGGLAVVRKMRRIGYNVFVKRPKVGGRDLPEMLLRGTAVGLGWTGRRPKTTPLDEP